MFKKLVIVSAVLAVSSNVALAKHHHQRHHKSVDYKNEQVVPAATPVVESAHVVENAVGGPYVGVGLGVANKGSFTGLVDNFFAGYGKTIYNNYYLGGELFGNAGSIALSGQQYNNRANYGLGASVIPGVMLTRDTMAYGRIGVKASQYHGSNSTHTGGQLGLGVQTSIAQNWDVRGEYDYTGYGIINNFTKKATNQVGVGLVYKIS
jgi:opacity protein-like surface antigen